MYAQEKPENISYTDSIHRGFSVSFRGCSRGGSRGAPGLTLQSIFNTNESSYNLGFNAKTAGSTIFLAYTIVSQGI